MKMNFSCWRFVMPALLLVVLFSCGGDEPSNPQNQIIKTWFLDESGYVKQNETDVSDNYAGLSISFSSNGTYTTSNANKLFFPSGTWNWTGSTVQQFALDGDHIFNVIKIDSKTLHVTFEMTVDDVNPAGKSNAVVGDYEVLLKSN